ncbi:hypothetical protein GS429_09405 [Natronorubrum sp. JWXQ-INN-674]|uniref:Uncharacterized protein n=1 Tax=Natronorubrum halalkaliphilum TaxID=2691917 RepID=A0A6B0VM91_9EURY|nr:hypothetical protein [Natronorubrum halalkaliphilum]MXV62275.1 hypothetical protein [Natronorubrum halalkaliphilum]
MGREPTVFEAVRSRETLLQRLANQPAGPDDLTADLEASRSTVDRGLSELQRIGLVEQAGGRYRLSHAGTLALAEFDRLSTQFDALVDSRDLLASIPAAVSLDPSVLENATVVHAGATAADHSARGGGDGESDGESEGERQTAAETATNTSESPTDPQQVFKSLLETGTRLRGVAPGLEHDLVTAVCDAICSTETGSDGLEVEFALPGDAVETLVTTFREPAGTALETGRVALFQTPEPLPHGLAVIERDDGDGDRDRDRNDSAAELDIGDDPVIVLAVCDESGVRGVIVTDDADALEWARTRLDEVWADTESLSAPHNP